jgi:hypothetical protein
MVAFATVDDVEARWRPLTPEEAARADALLEDASQILRDEFPLTVEAEVAKAATLKRIVSQMTIRALTGGIDLAGVESITAGTGPFSESRKFTNPNADLYVTKAERKQLGLGGRQVAFTVDPLDGYVAPWDRLVL